MRDRATLARKLIDEYDSKALELLMDYLKDEKIRAETERYIGQNDPSPARLDTAFEQQPTASPTHVRRSSSSLHQRVTRQNMPDGRHGLHTPSNSAGSVKSHASGGLAAAGMEKIYFLSADEQGKDQTVIARPALGRYNLIGDKVVYGRSLADGQFGVNESVLVHLASGEQRWVGVKDAVDLTWRRPHEFKTSQDTFYIVPAKLLDSDVVLASDEYLERELPSDVQEAHSPQARYQQGFVDDQGPAIPPHAPTAPLYPYQQSYPPPAPDVHRTYNRVQTMHDTQRMHVAEPSASAAHARHMNRGQSTQTVPRAAPDPSSDQLLMTGLWDNTPIKMLFDPDEAGVDFYQAFVQWAERRGRGGDLDRQRMTLLLKTSETTPDHEAYELELKESELEVPGLWKAAVAWIQKNKSPEAPHLYATVVMGVG